MQNMTDRNTGADKLKIGVYGGAFNPVHNGHIKLAEYFYNTLSLDKLMFIPTADPPHKSSSDFASAADRMNMLNIAIDGKNGFEVSDIEFNRVGKSYSVITLEELKSQYKNCELYLIIGADQFLSFNTWYRYKDILDMAVLCTAARELNGQREEMLEFSKSLDGLKTDRFFLADYEVYKVSSSEIREKIKNDEDASPYLPNGVFEYIKEKGLYIV